NKVSFPSLHGENRARKRSRRQKKLRHALVSAGRHGETRGLSALVFPGALRGSYARTLNQRYGNFLELMFDLASASPRPRLRGRPPLPFTSTGGNWSQKLPSPRNFF